MKLCTEITWHNHSRRNLTTTTDSLSLSSLTNPVTWLSSSSLHHEKMNTSSPSQPSNEAETPNATTEVVAADPPPSEPHRALFLVIYYLRLPDLLAFQCVCKSLRDAIAEDTLVWRDIQVDPPLCWMLSDYNLMKITSRASGTLRSLCLLNCWTITDYALQRIVFDNPHIARLYLQGCSDLTPEYVCSLIRCLSNQSRELKQVRLYGMKHAMPKNELEELKSLIERNCSKREHKPTFYNQWHTDSDHLKIDWNDDCNPIDIDVCPICDQATLVFECTKETCRLTSHNLRECRGCINCIPRCVECGNCLDIHDSFGEGTLCWDLVCLECWLLLKKCNTCNMPYCKKHMTSKGIGDDFTCESCRTKEFEQLDGKTNPF